MLNRTVRIPIDKAQILTFTVFLIIVLASCQAKRPEGTERFVPAGDTEEFHADNDIAMTIRSLADAIKVGEPLDSSFYNSECVLTDGQGTPLYTDIQGAPGLWEISVLDNKNVRIRNLYLGDLLPEDLKMYLLQSLRLSDTHSTPLLDTSMTDSNGDDGAYKVSVYDFGGGFVCFEVTSGLAPNGLEGPLLSIVMTAERPAGV